MEVAGEPPRSRDGRVVLFIVTSFWAYGELTIAMEFARRMAGSGFRPLFLLPPTHRALIAGTGWDHQVLIPNAGKLNRIQLNDIQLVHRPALVVLADFLNYDFCDRHYGLTRDDLRVFDCPVGTFDNFTWGRQGAWLDTYGFRALYQDQMALGDVDFRLRPCPLNSPVPAVEPDVFPYPLLADDQPTEPDLDPAEVRRLRMAAGVDPDRPLVLLTGATWQRMHVAYPMVTTFVDAFQTMLERVLLRLLDDVAVVSVGPPLVFPDGAPPGMVHLGPLNPPRFAELARAVDLHISNNLVSVSLHRLALAGVPSIALFSSLTKSEDTLAWASGRDVPLTEFAADVVAKIPYLYPFRMFPVGWYHFLRSLLDGNPFTEVVRHVEIFDEHDAVAAVDTMLTDPATRARLATTRRDYLAALAALPDVGTVLTRIAATEVRS